MSNPALNSGRRLPSGTFTFLKEISDLKANMDEKEFASLWADGRFMTMEEAIELALNE